MESHSVNQQLVSVENQENNNAAPLGDRQEIPLEPGYRFRPTSEEIIVHYLRKKIADPEFKCRAISDKDVYSLDPWQLYDDREKMSQEDLFFFTKLVMKISIRPVINRATNGGLWSRTGPGKKIYSDNGVLIGMKRSFVFYAAPDSMITNWMMHEYGLHEDDVEDWVVCRFFQKAHGKVDSPEKWPGALESSSRAVTLPTENFLHTQRLTKGNEKVSYSAGPVGSNNDSFQQHFGNVTVGSSSVHLNHMNRNRWPAPPQQEVASVANTTIPSTTLGTVYRSPTHSEEQRGYSLNQQQFNMPTQQGQPRPVYRSSTHSDERRACNHNQQAFTMPNTLQGPYPLAHPASNTVSANPYITVNQQLPAGIGPFYNLHSDIGSITNTRPLGENFSPNFMQPDFGSHSSPDQWVYNHNQRAFNMPTTLQGPYPPSYPATNMFSTNPLVNQQLPGISTSPNLIPGIGSIPRPLGGNSNPNFTRPDFGSNSSRNPRPPGGNYNPSSMRHQGRENEPFLPNWQPSQYNKK